MAGLVSKNSLVKILGKGNLPESLKFMHMHSANQLAAIEAKKGTAVKL